MMVFIRLVFVVISAVFPATVTPKAVAAWFVNVCPLLSCVNCVLTLNPSTSVRFGNAHGLVVV